MRLQLRAASLALASALTMVVLETRADEPPAPPEELEPPEEPEPPLPPARTPAEAPQPPPPTKPPVAEPPAPAPSRSNLTSRVSADVSGYVDNVATTVLTPTVAGTVQDPLAGWAANGRYLVDIVSAASPDIVSTASPPFKEIRQAGNLGFRYKPGNFGVGGNALASYSPDYLSLGGGINLSQDLNEKNYTLTEGYQYGHDVIGRTGTPFSVFSRQLDIHAMTLGVSSVINKAFVLGLTGDAILERGDQSKPYRYIPIFSPAAAGTIARGASVESVIATRLQARPLEQLPLSRDRFAMTARASWRARSATLRVEQRGYVDSWEQVASTTDARLFLDVGRRFIVWPHVRFHVQNSVSFWQRAYAATSPANLPALRTGDRELSGLYNIGLGGGVRVALGRTGQLDDFVWTTTLDGFHTEFADTIYIKSRLSAIMTTGLEVGF